MDLIDFDPAQAKRWVAQELAKANTGDKIRSRLTVEQATIERGDRFGLPNCYQAHKDLFAQLKARHDEMFGEVGL